jgi:hypothetical protein
MSEPLDGRSLLRALSAWSRSDPHGVRAGGGGGPGSFDHIQFHSRPDPREPEVQVTLRAELVRGQPAIRVTLSTPLPESERKAHASKRSASHTVLGGAGLPMREPTALCESCQAVGTVGCAVRTDGTGGVLATHRFCLACWPEQSARYRARWEEEDRQELERFLRSGASPDQHRGMAFGAATWHSTLQLVRDIERTMVPPVPPAPAALEQLANEISQSATQLDGPMPFEVEAFVHQYRSRDHGA